VTPAPADLLRSDREVFLPLCVGSVRLHVAHPQLERIETQTIGELVDHRLGDEARLRVTRGAERALRARIREHVSVRLPSCRKHVHRIRNGKPGARRTAGAPRFRVPRDELALRVDAGLHLRERRGPVAGDQVLVLAVEHDLDRRARRLRELRGDHELHVGAELAAEPAAHVVGDHPRVGLRNAETVRDAVARGVDPLRRHVQQQLVAVPLGNPAVGLERSVGLDLRLVEPFDDVRRGLERGLHLTFLREARLADVAARKRLRRAGTHRLLDGGERLEHLVLHLDQPHRIPGNLLRRRGDGGDFLPLVVDHRLGGIGGILDDERGLHTRQLLRGRDVDRGHTRARMRRPEDLSIDHPRADDVVGVLRLALRLVGSVEALDGFAEKRALRHGRPCAGRP
jgi:hypothetical protein